MGSGAWAVGGGTVLILGGRLTRETEIMCHGSDFDPYWLRVANTFTPRNSV